MTSLSTQVVQEDLYTLLVGQLRYSLGRRSYIVGVTADLVRKYARDLTANQRDTLLADLRRHVEDNRRGLMEEPRDIAEVWSGLLDEMEAARA